MFKSKARSLNIPQYEHSRLSGIFALLWGNEEFDRPLIDNAAFVQGVALHDWHYGVVDNLPIGEACEAEWLVLVRQGVEYWFDDPILDILAKLQLKRLLDGRESPEAERLINLVETRISERLEQTRYSRQQFEWADKITKCCDDLAFHFSFEKPVEGSLPVYAKIDSREETLLTYAIRAAGEITIGPWPFAQPSFSGLIIGYERAGYPDRLQPRVIPYSCRPG